MRNAPKSCLEITRPGEESNVTVYLDFGLSGEKTKSVRVLENIIFRHLSLSKHTCNVWWQCRHPL